MKAIFAALFVIGLSASAFAQVSPERAGTRKPSLDDSNPAYYNEFIVGPRITAIGGTAFDTTHWSTLYGIGFGLQADVAHLWRVDSGSYIGLYAGASWDEFTGKNRDLGGGAKKSAENLDIFGGELGVMFRENLGHSWFTDARFGVGVIRNLDAKLKRTFPGLTLEEDFIAATTGFMFTVGLRAGTKLSDSVELALGVAFQQNDAPDAGGLFNVSFKDQSNVVISLTLDLNF
jgi:hypothetical protein